jgi:hypothetical protein
MTGDRRSINRKQPPTSGRRIISGGVFYLFIAVGLAAFLVQALRGEATRAWQAYLISFLLFSAIAHGGLLFSCLMHTVKARWSGVLSDVAEAFSAFFPVSLVLFLLLFAGRHHLFPWLGEDLHGKEAWLNLPFLFGRDLAGLLLLYGLGLGYVYYSRLLKAGRSDPDSALSRWVARRRQAGGIDTDLALRRRYEGRKTILAILYMLAFAVVLSLLGYDLVMGVDPHWYSTLFGAYSFIKAVYVGFGGLIILSAMLHLHQANSFVVAEAQFHDLGKLFLTFCLIWADFFYAQFVVIWYGNIPEETAYIIERTMTPPWQVLAWLVFAVCFVGPFLILLNKKIKTIPKAMIVICAAVILGMWLEHFLLVGPALMPHVHSLPLSWSDPLIALGFLGALALAVTAYINRFPDLLNAGIEGGR